MLIFVSLNVRIYDSMMATSNGPYRIIYTQH